MSPLTEGGGDILIYPLFSSALALVLALACACSCERDIFLRMKVRIPKFGTLIGLIKTSDEFEDGPSETP